MTNAGYEPNMATEKSGVEKAKQIPLESFWLRYQAKEIEERECLN